MIELLNRIWQSVKSLYTLTTQTAAQASADSVLLAHLEIKLDHILTDLASIHSTLLTTNATLDRMTESLDSLRSLVLKILAEVTPLPTARLLFTFTSEEGEITTGEEYMKITVTQKFAAAITPVDKFGNAALVDGKPTWEAADPAIISIVPANDGLSATILALGPVGTSQVSVTADADLGTGVVTITDAFQVDVVAGMAVGLGVTIGEAVEQDAPTL